MKVFYKKIAASFGILFLLMILAAWGFPTSAKTNRVVMPEGTRTVKELFSQIEKQTPYIFAVNDTGFNVSQRVELSKSDYALNDLLDEVLSGTGNGYTISRGHIIIMEQTEGSPPPGKNNIKLAPEELENQEPEVEYIEEVRTYEEVTYPPFEGKRTYELKNRTLYTDTREIATEKATLTKGKPATWVLKTNLLYGFGTLTPNLGLEIGLAPKMTLNIAGGYNPWGREGTDESNKKLVHWLGNIEYRYWLCERFNGHFFGAHILGSQYNISEYDIPLLFEKEYRYYGWAIGGGISYGYHWMCSRKWGMEFNIGIGAAYLKYQKYGCPKCEVDYEWEDKVYFGPTRAGITLIFVLD